MGVLATLQALRRAQVPGFAVLLDPHELRAHDLPELIAALQAARPTLVLLGGSLVGTRSWEPLVAQLRASLTCPVVLFPGHVSQLTAQADAVLFLSLISGRNPELLIGQHVHAAPRVRELGLEVVPTGYLLFDTGRPTAAHYMSHTPPLPAHKPELAAYTALAGTYLGLQVLYLDAGSGAAAPIPPETVRAVRALVDVPIIVGGGIRSPEQAQALLAAGADCFVVGTAFEEAHPAGGGDTLLAAFAALALPAH